MSLLYDLLREMAAAGSTSAGDIANSRGSLFGGGAVDLKKHGRRKTKILRRLGYMPADSIAKIKQSNAWKVVKESTNQPFDTSDVISKLDAAERRAKADTDTVTFGMEDDSGNIIKVSVRADQADEFEQTLALMLAGADDDDNYENTGSEIAEVLFNLKDKFQIINVEWPTIEGDEEEEQKLEGDRDQDLESREDLESGEDLGGKSSSDLNVGNSEEDVKSTLSAVISMMKADAEAKKSEAEARKAEADANISKHAASIAKSKVSQEEQILDMEAHEKAKSDAKKEAKLLAKLAKYKHETQNSNSDVDIETTKSNISIEDEDEETSELRNYETISKEDLANLLLKHMAANN